MVVKEQHFMERIATARGFVISVRVLQVSLRVEDTDDFVHGSHLYKILYHTAKLKGITLRYKVRGKADVLYEHIVWMISLKHLEDVARI